MIRSELKAHINASYRGSDDDAPTSGTPDATLWDLTINRKISEWAGDSKVYWNSLFLDTTPNELGTVTTTGTTTLTGTGTYFLDYQVGDKIIVNGETERTIDTITSNTLLTVSVAFANSTTTTFTHKNIIKVGVQTYNLHRQFINASDDVIIKDTNDINYTIDKPQRREDAQTYISGVNPQSITFVEEIKSDSNLLGLEFTVPGYYAPLDLTSDNDVIPVDDPYWLVMSVASELAFNDLTYENKAPALNIKANALYQGMISNNNKGTSGRSRTVRYNVSNNFSLDRG